MARFVRYYLMPEVWATVTESQVFGWVRLANDSGFTTHCLSILDFRKYLRNRRIDKRKIASQLGGRFRQIPIIANASIAIDIQVFVVLLMIWLKEFLVVDKLVFQSRMSAISYALSWIRRFPKVRVIFDSRGADVEELRYIEGGRDSWRAKVRLYLTLLHEQKAVRSADRVFVVSEQLLEYHLRKGKDLSKHKIVVVPGAADRNSFFFEQSLRDRCRRDLTLQDEIVLVYSGGLAQKWAVPDKLFELLQAVRSHIDNVILLVLTPDVDIGTSLRKKYGLSEKEALVTRARYQDVNKYLNAGDIGLLLRENDPTNTNASPTKFSEYLLCGLPVIISSSVTDFAAFVRQQQVGYVLESFDELASKGSGRMKALVEFISSQGKLSSADRTAIMQKGASRLSKQIFLPKIFDVFNTI